MATRRTRGPPPTFGMSPAEKSAYLAQQAKEELARSIVRKKWIAHQAAVRKAEADKRAAKRQAIKKSTDRKLISSWKASAAATLMLKNDTLRRLAENKTQREIAQAEAKIVAQNRLKNQQAQAVAQKSWLKSKLTLGGKKTTTTSRRSYYKRTTTRGGVTKKPSGGGSAY